MVRVILSLTFLTFFTLQAHAIPQCQSVKYRYKTMKKLEYKKANLCLEKFGKRTLIYSENCKDGNCHLISALKGNDSGALKSQKRLFDKSEVGTPAGKKCMKLNGRSLSVELEKTFYPNPTTLCVSNVDDSILSKGALLYWNLKDPKVKIKSSGATGKFK